MLTTLFRKAKEASRSLALIDDTKVIAILNELATVTHHSASQLLIENKKDLDRMSQSDPKYDRLQLSDARISTICNDLSNVAKLPSPLSLSLDKRTLSNGLQLEKISVALGTIGIIYEARPNVTFDVFALCIKSGNGCILKGGSDAESSNRFIVDLIRQVLSNNQVEPHVITLLPPERSSTDALLTAIDYVDVIIPRGSQNLIRYVRNNAKVPVIETGAGIVHIYFDVSGQLDFGKNIIFNSKTRRVSVCNALDCLIIHQDRLQDLSALTQDLATKNVIIYADKPAFDALKTHYPKNLLEHADSSHYGSEFLAYKMSIKTVNCFDAACQHIEQYSSKHSEAIIASEQSTIDLFLKRIDAAAVYVNASTAFTDGGEFGMGAEIGISTQKLHARGPMALNELTSYKWLIIGQGTVRA